LTNKGAYVKSIPHTTMKHQMISSHCTDWTVVIVDDDYDDYDDIHTVTVHFAVSHFAVSHLTVLPNPNP